MDPTEFLAARLDEDEDYARTMIEVGERNAADATPDDVAAVAAFMLTASAGFMARPEVVALVERYTGDGTLPPNNLERVLREVAAKRAIVRALEAARRERPAAGSPRDDPYDPAASYSAGEHSGLLAAAEALAAVWSDHPDCDPEWKP
jgi:hypothetical protein